MKFIQTMYYIWGCLFYGAAFLAIAKVLVESMNAGEYSAQIRSDDEGWKA